MLMYLPSTSPVCSGNRLNYTFCESEETDCSWGGAVVLCMVSRSEVRPVPLLIAAILILSRSRVSERSGLARARVPFRFRVMRLPTMPKLARVAGKRIVAIPVWSGSASRRTKLHTFNTGNELKSEVTQS